MVLGGQAAWADTITFWNTGVAADGSLLAAGSADTHYTLIDSADPNGTMAMATSAHSAWTQPTSTAGWISPGSSGYQNWDSGYYVYQTTFDLTGYDVTTASLSGMIAADDSVAVYLNGSGLAAFNGSTGFSSLTPFLISSGFVSGVNTVDFVVHNDDGPTGLMVDDTVATAQTPEPGSLLLMATGLAGGGFLVLRRSRSRTDDQFAGM